jgi:tetratricopeptide (TPR) repeat protein
MTRHVDDFVLLRCVVGDLAEDERASIASHLDECPQCRATVTSLEKLDGGLRAVASSGDFGEGPTEFAPDDPFRRRPRLRVPDRTRLGSVAPSTAIAASERGTVLRDRILEAVRRGAGLPDLLLREAEQRYALLYALQQAGREIAEGPVRASAFAEAVLRKVRSESAARRAPEEAEQSVPLSVIRGQAHLLTAMACMWTRDFSRARSSLVLAYRAFARGGGGEIDLALVESVEAQRRAFANEGAGALVLARRAQTTFEELGVDDLAARAIGARGLAFSTLGREEDAVRCFREALPVYERHELWSNYVGCLNSIATSLNRLGRVDEARREYARALRRFSQERHRSLLGYLRTGLAETLFGAGRFSQASVAAARAAQVFRDAGMRATGYIATLLEIESRVRQGSLDRARHRLDLLRREISRDPTLDPSVIREIADALSVADPDMERLGTLRLQIEELIARSAREKTG